MNENAWPRLRFRAVAVPPEERSFSWERMSDRDARVVAQWIAGRHVMDIAREFGICRARVQSIARRYWVPRFRRVAVQRLRCRTCGGHYSKGETLVHARTAEHFFGGLDRTGECWVHRSGRRNSRQAWRLAYGEIPGDLWVLHRCDNEPCCRPDHLFLGTPSDNAQDREQKGRGGHKSYPLTHCKRGHPLSGDNLEWFGERRACKTCHHAAQARYRERAKRRAA